ncbi:hypothetical protein [Streptomyces spiramenti]|uniref:Secondary metabolite protein n=1 Tax=Streptomyces spiramenti TaxID=2720606 RepID=A0ABX1ACG5_9ACTN|nr:hypothetical protein [Streptomyces spiramenti]NJP64799.1 hypothetical protein [Streptomyces spiramenti]
MKCLADTTTADAGSSLHRDHIVLHEIGHILHGHVGSDATGPGANLDALFTGIDPATVRGVLGRASFSNHQEREAEEFATRVARRALLPPLKRKDPELARIDTALRGE